MGVFVVIITVVFTFVLGIVVPVWAGVKYLVGGWKEDEV